MSQSLTRQSSRGRNAIRESSLCKFPFADGRRCRMLRHPSHPSLCPFHARTELQLRESHKLGTELSTTISGDFMTATDINHALGKLYTAIAQDRIPARNAATMAYVGQLLLNSVDGVKSEFKFSYKFDQWDQMTKAAKPLSLPPSSPFVSSQSTRQPESAAPQSASGTETAPPIAIDSGEPK